MTIRALTSGELEQVCRTARSRGDVDRRGVAPLRPLLGYLARSVDLVGRELWDPARDPDQDRRACPLDLEEVELGADIVAIGSRHDEDPFERAASAERCRRLIEAPGALPPDARVIALRYLSGMSGEEVGFIERQSPQAVRARLCRAMSQLRAVAPEALRESESARAA